MSNISNWEASATQELTAIEDIRLDLTSKINDLLNNFTTEAHSTVLQNLREHIVSLGSIMEVYNQRSLLLASYFDKAHKTSTLVLDNFEKMEECVEIAKNEMKDIMKKLCSFSTLEMDYHEKLLEGHSESETDSFKKDYENYRKALNQVHRNDQIRIFSVCTSDMLITVQQVINKFVSILSNPDNMNEVKKLWEKQYNHLY